MLYSSDELNCAKQLIDAEDLSFVIDRLTDIERWSKANALEACQQYKRFIFLKKKYGATYTLPPSSDIDEVWHAHILHTEQYDSFCKKVFGYFLHHHPHEMNGAITKEQYAELFENETQLLHHKEYNEYIYAVRSNNIIKNSFIFLKNILTSKKSKPHSNEIVKV